MKCRGISPFSCCYIRTLCYKELTSFSVITKRVISAANRRQTLPKLPATYFRRASWRASCSQSFSRSASGFWGHVLLCNMLISDKHVTRIQHGVLLYITWGQNENSYGKTKSSLKEAIEVEIAFKMENLVTSNAPRMDWSSI